MGPQFSSSPAAPCPPTATVLGIAVCQGRRLRRFSGRSEPGKDPDRQNWREATMADDKGWPRSDEVKELELENRERMTERALSTIRQTGTAAALNKCSRIADQLNAK